MKSRSWTESAGQGVGPEGEDGGGESGGGGRIVDRR